MTIDRIGGAIAGIPGAFGGAVPINPAYIQGARAVALQNLLLANMPKMDQQNNLLAALASADKELTRISASFGANSPPDAKIGSVGQMPNFASINDVTVKFGVPPLGPDSNKAQVQSAIHTLEEAILRLTPARQPDTPSIPNDGTTSTTDPTQSTTPGDGTQPTNPPWADGDPTASVPVPIDTTPTTPTTPTRPSTPTLPGTPTRPGSGTTKGPGPEPGLPTLKTMDPNQAVGLLKTVLAGFPFFAGPNATIGTSLVHPNFKEVNLVLAKNGIKEIGPNSTKADVAAAERALEGVVNKTMTAQQQAIAQLQALAQAHLDAVNDMMAAIKKSMGVR